MARFRAPPALQQFVENELLRMPIVLESSFQPTLDSLQRSMAQLVTGSERQVIAEVILRLSSQRPRMVDRYIASLREQTTAEMLGQGVASHEVLRPAAGLSLVEDEEVATDVAISHAIESIRSEADHELRELMAFASALVGDMDVAADYNPLRAETQARALWAAAGTLPLSRTHQVAFMRHATPPVAQALRKAYASACARLEELGIEPAVYRTVIPPAGSRKGRQRFDGSVDSLSPGSLAPPARPGAETARKPQIAIKQQGQDSADVLDAELIQRISRLFAHLLADRTLPSEMHALVSRLQGLALQAAAADATVPEQPAHPLWRFIDLLAHQALLDAGPDGEHTEALVVFAGRLVEQVSGESRQTRQLHDWALERLQRYIARRLSDRTAAAQPQIADLRALEQRMAAAEGPISTFHGALDAAYLDTVPADLMDDGGPEDSSHWLLSLRVGDWLRLFRKGRWRDCQLLWSGDRGELWLFGDDIEIEPWAMRRSALQLLREARLAEVQQPRPRVQQAMTATARRGA